ncbi:hypothetical protein GGR56DRAFT_508967 [Xylariaceae sp. FL0804]|nr:hypothetical protein GGR56DRAFT_508967 [Xylariaceae sp. FL0804]
MDPNTSPPLPQESQEKKFTLFSRLPQELQDKIWKASFTERAVNYLRLTRENPFSNKLVLRPFNTKASARSPWLVENRRKIAEVCKTTDSSLPHYKETSDGLVYSDDKSRRTIKLGGGRTAVIDRIDGLLVLRVELAYGHPVFLGLQQNRSLFSNITRIGIDPKDVRGHLLYLYRCACVPGPGFTYHDRFCPSAIINFIKYLPNIKFLYILHQLTATQVRLPMPPQYVRLMPASQKIPIALRIIEKNALDVFRDQKVKYFEVDPRGHLRHMIPHLYELDRFKLEIQTKMQGLINGVIPIPVSEATRRILENLTIKIILNADDKYY